MTTETARPATSHVNAVSRHPASVRPAEVRLIGVVKQYGAARALDGIDLQLAPGELVALLGPSGCGKTTALRSLAGLERITEGRIELDGADVSGTPTNRRDLGMVFQAYSLFPHLTVLENVEFGLRMRKVAVPDRAARAVEALELVGLAHLGQRYAHQLSGGQQQRVALARALVTRPRVLLLDEPLSALDAKVRVQLREQIRRIQTGLRITTLFVTHDQEEALAIADRVAVMRAGRIEQIGTPEELYREPATPFVADFVGLSNRIPGEVAGGAVELLGQRLPVLGEAADGPVTAYVRPENVRFAEDGARGVVVSTSFLGSLRRTVVRLGRELLVSVQHDVHDEHTAGDAVHLRLAPRAVTVAPRE